MSDISEINNIHESWKNLIQDYKKIKTPEGMNLLNTINKDRNALRSANKRKVKKHFLAKTPKTNEELRGKVDGAVEDMFSITDDTPPIFLIQLALRSISLYISKYNLQLPPTVNNDADCLCALYAVFANHLINKEKKTTRGNDLNILIISSMTSHTNVTSWKKMYKVPPKKIQKTKQNKLPN
jgi:hypothetical protein